MGQSRFALDMPIPRVNDVAGNQKRYYNRDAAITDQLLPVLFKKRNCVFDFKGELV
jgi:hypothetical protein